MSNEKAKVTASDIASKFCNFLDKEKPAPSSRWLNLVNLIEAAKEAARAEGFADAQERAAKIADDVCDPYDGSPIMEYAERIRALKPQ